MSRSNKTREACKLVLLLIIGALTVVYSKQGSNSIRASLLFSATTVIPALFPFMIVAKMISSTNAFEDIFSSIEGTTIKQFKLNTNGMIPVLIGFLSGFPIGVMAAVEKYNEGKLSKKEAERIIALSHNTGPSFPIGFVGIQLWGSVRFGVSLYMFQVLSWLITARLWKGNCSPKSSSANTIDCRCRKNISIQLTETISETGLSLLAITAFTVFFRLCIDYCRILLPNLSFSVYAYIASILEMTEGCCSAAAFGGLWGCAATGFAIGFGGLSALMQAIAAVTPTKLSVKPLLTVKLISGGLCSLFAAVYVLLFPIKAPVRLVLSTLNVTRYARMTFTSAICIFVILIFLTKGRKRI